MKNLFNLALCFVLVSFIASQEAGVASTTVSAGDQQNIEVSTTPEVVELPAATEPVELPAATVGPVAESIESTFVPQIYTTIVVDAKNSSNPNNTSPIQQKGQYGSDNLLANSAMLISFDKILVLMSAFALTLV
ncbi:unnamed protein product [Brachionus calyciflorus]|uniref:Uncharacterized protein n=1 Tax=Brachionus calyciflorus TaxID=104777 RepID=A0A814A056_9BILA|nr:unnamed protein product [Brachionus calyciflorus]